jgi:hypothetical protein
VTDHGKAPTFVVTEPQAPPAQLCLHYAIFFPQEFDDIVLLAFEPAEQRRDDQVSKSTHGVYDKAARMQFSDTTGLPSGGSLCCRLVAPGENPAPANRMTLPFSN